MDGWMDGWVGMLLTKIPPPSLPILSPHFTYFLFVFLVGGVKESAKKREVGVV